MVIQSKFLDNKSREFTIHFDDENSITISGKNLDLLLTEKSSITGFMRAVEGNRNKDHIDMRIID